MARLVCISTSSAPRHSGRALVGYGIACHEDDHRIYTRRDRDSVFRWPSTWPDSYYAGCDDSRDIPSVDRRGYPSSTIHGSDRVVRPWEHKDVHSRPYRACLHGRVQWLGGGSHSRASFSLVWIISKRCGSSYSCRMGDFLYRRLCASTSSVVRLPCRNTYRMVCDFMAMGCRLKAWSGRGMARPVYVPTSLAPRHSGRAFDLKARWATLERCL